MHSVVKLVNRLLLKPYPINQKQLEEDHEKTVERERAKAKVWMENWVNAYK